MTAYHLCRYVCGPEAAHRIFGFDIHHRSISVERLPFHLPNQKYVAFHEKENLEKVCQRAGMRNSKLEAFFQLCQTNDDAKNFTYQEIPEHFVWDSSDCLWQKRKKGTHYGRLNLTHHAAGEMWYLRMLLARVRGPKSYKDLRTVGDKTYNTFQETCAALGLLKDDNEWHEAIRENERTAFPFQLRSLFVHIIVNCEVTDVNKLWTSNWQCMADDILYNQQKSTGNRNLRLDNEELQNYALAGLFCIRKLPHIKCLNI